MIVVGNKSDLKGREDRFIIKEKAKEIAKEWDESLFIECSAKENVNVEEAFEMLAKHVLGLRGEGQEKVEGRERDERKKTVKGKRRVLGRLKRAICSFM